MDYTIDETAKIAGLVLGTISPSKHSATVVGLKGDLGAGKTSLVKEIGKKLEVSETIISPTYVIMKSYDLENKKWLRLIHIDAYRIEDISELGPLGWTNILEAPNTLVLVEWPEKIVALMPETSKYFEILHSGNLRHINL